MEKTNKLIAIYGGYEIPNQTHKELNWIMYDGIFQPMMFHKSWDWLMPIIKKIEKDAKTIPSNLFLNWSSNNNTIFDIKLTEASIDKTYKAVIEFIHVYNKNKI